LRLRHPPTDALTKRIPSCGGPVIRISSVRREPFAYVPLRCHSYYSFLDSTLSPSALVAEAKLRGLTAVALTDKGNLHGAVEFVSAAQAAGIKPLLGVGFLVESKPLILYVESAKGYNNLCLLLSHHAKQMSDGGDDSIGCFGIFVGLNASGWRPAPMVL
jgi:hypothetical protein